MNTKKTLLPIQNKSPKKLDNANNHPTVDDLMREQNVSSNVRKAVHYRRDLDSLN